MAKSKSKLLFVCAFALLLGCARPVLGDWFVGNDHKMHFPQLPDLDGWDVRIPGQKLADDWECSETGLVDGVHFWVSWKEDNVGVIDSIKLAIYDNDLTGPYSKPGLKLWEGQFLKADFTVLDWGDGDQGWYDPTGGYTDHDHQNIYQINIKHIDAKVGAFHQKAGEMYWLEVSVATTGGSIGWKTSLDDFEDNAVRWDPGAPDWQELFDPITSEALNLAFVIAGMPSGPVPILPDPVLTFDGLVSVEPWHHFWPLAYEAPPTNVTLPDPCHRPAQEVHFWFSPDGNDWEQFYVDYDGNQPSEGPTVASAGGDGWTGYLPLELIEPVQECSPVYIRAEVYSAIGVILVDTECSIDPTPPDSVSLNVSDWQVVQGGTLLVDVDPILANIKYVLAYVEEKPEQYVKGIPGIDQQEHSDTHCAPTAAAACLKYFENEGDGEICDDLNDFDLVEALADRAATNLEHSGTYPTDLANGLRSWIRDHGGGYTVRGPLEFNWKQVRNELERSQDVLVGIYWPDDKGHRMTMNSIVNRPLPDGKIRVDFMDPWTGTIEYGNLDPNTGELTDFEGSSGDTGILDNIIIICPRESDPNGGAPGRPQPGPDPDPIPVAIPYPGLWALHVIVVDDCNHAARLTRIVERKAPKPPVEHLKWSQPPIEIDPDPCAPIVYCGWDELSYTDDPCNWWTVVADDFRCLGNMPVTSIHWWGSYAGWDDLEPPAETPIAWRIGFWSNVPASPWADPNYSYPQELLWQIELDAVRVQQEMAGMDQPPWPYPVPETCFQYYVDLQPHEYFWQGDYETYTLDNVFWLSITAIYPSGSSLDNAWGWKTRPWHWMDDAVRFNLEEDPQTGMVLDPWNAWMEPIEDWYTGQSYDVAFELDTDPNYIKWEQAYDSIRHWPHYEDILSMAGPVTETKWRQQPDPNGWDVDFGTTFGLADDWLCTETGPVSDVHFWCSWRGDAARPIQSIDVWIWSDDPCDYPGDYSKPNRELWNRTFFPADFTVSWAGEGEQGWLDPYGSWYRPDHNNFFHIDIEDINDPFVQTEGNIYWLNIRMNADGSEGWKTSLDHWNDNAVYHHHLTGSWEELYDPCTGEVLDLAFEIGTKKDYGLRAQAADDWRCDQNTPVTAAVWWGSYIGYQYEACQPPQLRAPMKPDAFLLSIWTDVPGGADPCYPFSHPGEKIWEYRADDYDEVLVGYDKHPLGAIGPPREPVFRYSVRLPDDEQFFQEGIDDIYWFSVVAVYDQNIPSYDWGWTNHSQYYNDNAVSGNWQFDPLGGPRTWVWQELYDQAGAGADMSFILFTEPAEPTCWDNVTQCAGQSRGDGTCNGQINFGDLFALKTYFGRCAPWMAPECCSDYNQSGCINFGDLFILKTNFGTFGYVPSTGNQNCP